MRRYRARKAFRRMVSRCLESGISQDELVGLVERVGRGGRCVERDVETLQLDFDRNADPGYGVPSVDRLTGGLPWAKALIVSRTGNTAKI